MSLISSLSKATQLVEALDWFQWAGLIVAGTLAYSVFKVIYNIYFHPLSTFPGPIQRHATILPWAYHFFLGKGPHSALALHEEYGPVVRISPEEISFADPEAWRDIYGSSLGNENPKHHTFYSAIGFNGVLSDEFTSAEKPTQRILKGILADGFSEKSMRRQEGLIQSQIDLFIKRLREKEAEAQAAETNDGNGIVLDLTEWFCFLVSDIVGDLTLGMSFGCLDRLTMTPYVDLLFNAAKIGGRVIVLWYLGLKWLVLALVYFFGGSFLQVMDETRDMLQARMAKKEGRSDLLEPIIKAHRDGTLSFNDVLNSSNGLVTAGTESSAWTLSALFYHLSTNRTALAKLVDEIRSSFSSEDEICLEKVDKLPYLTACLKETLRMYPALATALPRQVVAEGGRTIAGKYIPQGTVISISTYAIARYSKNFHDPFSFHPQRFLQGQVGSSSSDFSKDRLEAAQPFSVGPRSCVGRNLFWASSRLAVSKLLWNFEVEATPETEEWIEDHRIFLLFQHKPLAVRLRSVVRGD